MWTAPVNIQGASQEEKMIVETLILLHWSKTFGTTINKVLLKMHKQSIVALFFICKMTYCYSSDLNKI